MMPNQTNDAPTEVDIHPQDFANRNQETFRDMSFYWASIWFKGRKLASSCFAVHSSVTEEELLTTLTNSKLGTYDWLEPKDLTLELVTHAKLQAMTKEGLLDFLSHVRVADPTRLVP